MTAPAAGELLRSAAARLAATASLSPRLDAEVLLACALGVTRAALLAAPERIPSPDQSARFAELLDRRAGGWPVAYLTGTREFFGLDFAVTPDVLIPRPETELLVETVLAGEPDRAARGLELGTGSGCIAVALAQAGGFRLVATDRSAAALAVARGNAERHGVAARIEFAAGDWGDTVAGPFDFIVSNPPYIPDADYESLMPGVQKEPRAALLGGADGLDFYRRTLALLPRLLAPGGRLYLELGTGAAATRALFENAPGITDVRVASDLAGWPRVLAARWSADA